MGGNYYTLSDIQLILPEIDASIILPSNTIQAFDFILKNIVVPAPEMFNLDQDAPSTNSKTYDSTHRSDRNRRRGQKNKDRGSMDWESVRLPTFKPTKIETKEGVDKQINDFRILLNKISSKNYSTQCVLIFDKINEIRSISNDSDFEKVAETIFEIASANKFYSEIYADLYAELINKYSVFKDLMNGLLEKYSESLKNIHYVDNNVDYDGFCNYTKTNDLRKAMACFIINLMKKSAIDKEKVIDLISWIQTILKDYISSDNRTNEVDEIIENMYLFLTQCKATMNDNVKWVDLISYVEIISNMKNKEQKSLSTRAVFKCMDILDFIRK
jgi:hypothetical protein